jgi:hydroxyacylglutathione hydrolase
MSLVFEWILTEGLGELSYLIGDDETGIAAVVDPRADFDIYLQLALQHRLSITHVLQTHVHEDFLSGAVGLAKWAGGALLHMRHVPETEFTYAHQEIHHGDRLTLGSVTLTARATPGHTPEHTAYVLSETKRVEEPYAVFTGGSLLINAAGRCDLMGPEAAKRLVVEQFNTLYGFFLGLPDHVIIHPTHAHGSPCGAAIGDRLSSTVGYERKHNAYLQYPDIASFTAFALHGLPAKPVYYARLKEANTAGDGDFLPLLVPALSVTEFAQAVAAGGSAIVDTRSLHAFAGGHLTGALNIGGAGELSIWAGWMLDVEKPILLVLEQDTDLAKILALFVRTGFTKFAGYLVGGMKAWDDAGMPLSLMAPIPIHDLRRQLGNWQIIDVRSDDEWKKGRIPGAMHLFLPNLIAKLVLLDKGRPVATYCATGYRASLAASILKVHGFNDVGCVPGSWKAWTKAGFPVEVSP